MPVRMAPAVVTWFEPPGDAGNPHVGAVPATAAVPSSPAAPSSPTVPGGGHLVRAPRRWWRSPGSSPPGGGDDHRVEPPGDAGGHGPAPARSRARRRPRAAVTRFEPPGDAGGHGLAPARSRARRRCRSARPGPAVTGFEPLRVVAAVRSSPAVPGGCHQVRTPGRWRRSARRRDPARGHGPELAAVSVRALRRCRRSARRPPRA